ncbi:DUF559 domain-containing protein [bacterium]|nr:DUF559 domain-containing protein [bacterium]
MTRAEKNLWERLRDRQFMGHKFRRQHPIAKRFIVDFYCAKAKLAIELDGAIHIGREEMDKDRETYIKAHGIRIIRFKNNEVEKGINSVLERISKELERIPSS